MKTNKIVILTAFALGLAVSSCKKENPSAPINKNPCGGEVTECSFCPGTTMELNADGLVDETYAQQVPFYHYGNVAIAPFSSQRTPNGYYSYHEGMSIDFNLAELSLACMSNKITFAHARNTTNTNDDPALVNVKFPGVPRIVTVPDSLNYFLSPYGYTVQHFFQPGFVHMGAGAGFAGVVDSIIITGPYFDRVTVGANLFESELRSICIAHQ